MNATLAPQRSRDQRMDALQKANVVRTRRAQLKRDLKAGRATLAEYVADPPWWLSTAKVYDMLVATPKVARVKALRALRACQCSPSKTIGGLSDRQRADVVEHLRGVA